MNLLIKSTEDFLDKIWFCLVKLRRDSFLGVDGKGECAGVIECLLSEETGLEWSDILLLSLFQEIFIHLITVFLCE